MNLVEGYNNDLLNSEKSSCCSLIALTFSNWKGFFFHGSGSYFECR